MESIFQVNLKLPSEYREWVSDLAKFFVVLLSVHVLQFATRSTGSAGQGPKLFNVNFWKLVVFALLGFTAYHLVFKRIIRFRFMDEQDNEITGLYAINVAPLNFISGFREWLREKSAFAQRSN